MVSSRGRSGAMWGALAIVLVAAVAVVIVLPLVMSVVKTRAENPAVADRQTDLRNAAKSQNQPAPAAP